MNDRKRFIANSIAHFDIAGPDLEKLGPFYEALFGWDVKTRGPGYASVTTPDGAPNGALVEADEPSLTVGIVVPNLDDALARATERGGSVAMPVTNNGWVTKAQVRDPAGNLLTLLKG
jgi:predicted enzyme related to lactoylglutathione lyase